VKKTEITRGEGGDEKFNAYVKSEPISHKPEGVTASEGFQKGGVDLVAVGSKSVQEKNKKRRIKGATGDGARMEGGIEF